MLNDKLRAGVFLMRDHGLDAAATEEATRCAEPASELPEEIDVVASRRHLALQPRDSNHHDVLIVPPEGVVGSGEFFRVPVVKDPSSATLGQYEAPPETWDAADSGQRKVMSAAFPHEHGPEKYRHLPRGPAFSTLPIKPEPASTSCAACYLVSARNINYPNAWTHALWSSPSALEESSTAAHADAFDVLLAGPRGKVLRLRVNALERWNPADGALEVRAADGTTMASLEAIDLGGEMEIWQQLRNGCVAGRVLFEREERVVPLVNVTSLQALTPEPSSQQ